MPNGYDHHVSDPDTRRVHEHPPAAEIEISWSDGTVAYLSVSDKTADRMGRLIEDELGRKFNIAT